MVASVQDLMALCDSLNICKLPPLVCSRRFASLLNWETGWNIPFDEFLRIGERIYTLKRLYNVECGNRSER